MITDTMLLVANSARFWKPELAVETINRSKWRRWFL
ncbi:unnamed protein product [Brassica rapa subsp. trilocularis]